MENSSRSASDMPVSFPTETLRLPISSKLQIRLSIKRNKRDAIGPNRQVFYRWFKTHTTTRDSENRSPTIDSPCHSHAIPVENLKTHRGNHELVSAFPLCNRSHDHSSQAEAFRTNAPFIRAECNSAA